MCACACVLEKYHNLTWSINLKHLWPSFHLYNLLICNSALSLQIFPATNCTACFYEQLDIKNSEHHPTPPFDFIFTGNQQLFYFTKSARVELFTIFCLHNVYKKKKIYIYIKLVFFSSLKNSDRDIVVILPRPTHRWYSLWKVWASGWCFEHEWEYVMCVDGVISVSVRWIMSVPPSLPPPWTSPPLDLSPLPPNHTQGGKFCSDFSYIHQIIYVIVWLQIFFPSPITLSPPLFPTHPCTSVINRMVVWSIIINKISFGDTVSYAVLCFYSESTEGQYGKWKKQIGWFPEIYLWLVPLNQLCQLEKW